MTPLPPSLPRRVLARILRDHVGGSAILGDLLEDYAKLRQQAGGLRASAWYWREALLLTFSIGMRRLFAPLGANGRIDLTGDYMNFFDLNGLAQDSWYAFRSARRNLGFFVFATLIVGLGVGASTAVYSVMSPLMLAPLPFADPGQLVWLENDGGTNTSLSAKTARSSNLRDFRALARSFEGIAGYNAFFNQSSYTLDGGDGRPEQMLGVEVTSDFLDVVGIQMHQGRNFNDEEGAWQGPPAVILTHGFWTRRYGADPSIVGSSILLNDEAQEVVGILPATFDFSSIFTPTVPVDFLKTWAVSDETDRWGNSLFMIARLRPEVSILQAQAELDGIVAGLQEAEPDRWGLGGVISPLQAHIAGPFRLGMLLLAGAAAAVMLIVCVNLSNMLLARGPGRGREIAIRRSFGATRGRVVRQLMIESLFFSTGGAVVGAGIAIAVTRLVAGTEGINIPLLSEVGVDGSALMFTLVLSALVGLFVGIMPALQISEGDFAGVMRASGRGASSGRAAARLRELLVVSEVALACVLLVVGGLFMKSFSQVLDVELGYQPAEAVAWQLNPSQELETVAEQEAFFTQLVYRVGELPGIDAVGLVDALPLGKSRSWGVRVEGRTYDDGEGDSIYPHIISPGYFAAMEIPVVAGRDVASYDQEDTEAVAVVNETAAAAMFPNRDPIGGVILMGDEEVRVVGVVGNITHHTLEVGSGNQVYFPMSQEGAWQTVDLIVRSSLPTATITDLVSNRLSELDPGMPNQNSWTLESTVAVAASPRRFTVQVLGAFAFTALLLAGLGIYGVLSYSVTERTAEIGIRMALGASAAEVGRNILGRTLSLAVLGIVLGMSVSFFAARIVASLLFGVEPTDPMTFATMAALLLAVAGTSGLIPAIRAARTDSLSALQSE